MPLNQETSNDRKQASSQTARRGLDLLDYLVILARHKRMILGATFVAAVVSVAFSLSLANIYTARTMFLPSDEDKGIMGAMMAQMGGLAGIAGDLGGKTKADLYVTMLRSEAVKDSIIDRFKLMEVYQAEYRATAYLALDRRTKISTGKKDGVITIAVDDKDPKRAADIANAYVAELGKLALGLTMTGAGNNRLFLERKVAETRAELARAEDAMKKFQATNKAISVTDQAKATIEGVAQLRAQLAVQEVQLATLKGQFAEGSAEVRTARTAINSLRAQIGGLESSGGSSSIPNVGKLPALGQEYMRLMREFKIQEAVLEMLVKQYEMASLSEEKDVSPLQVIQVAKAPELKSKPSRSKIVFLACFITLVGSCLLAIYKELYARMSNDQLGRWNSLWAELPFLNRNRGGRTDAP